MKDKLFEVDHLVRWVSASKVLVRWSGYSPDHDTIEPVKNMPKVCVEDLVQREGVWKSPMFVVDHIVDWFDETHVIVRWDGFDDMQDTVEPIENMPEVCVDEFLKRVGSDKNKNKAEWRGELIYLLRQHFFTHRMFSQKRVR